ncbi:hypothetical protein V1478_001117 [Vespula squamosa]|uniref:Uncharacterized protein n=1 Tax=Vespula squamosa TaxID=30214 RepID=A0ABD2C7E8_VESSQ
MSGTWPYLKPSQRFTRVFIMSITLITSCSTQILHYLVQIRNDWSNIRQTKQFDVLLDYAFLYKKCIFMFICKQLSENFAELDNGIDS